MSRLSVITINYNDKPGLGRTISSVLAQSYDDFEYLVIDGGSTDGSAELIEKYKDRLAYSVSEKDNGIFNAQNKGALQAKGEYLLFLNSGDVLADKEVLKTFSQYLQKYDLVYGDLLVDDGETIERADMPDELGVYHFMISTLAHPCTFVSSALHQKLNGYSEDLKITGDFEFFLRAILVNRASYKHVPLPVSIFNTQGASSDPDNDERQSQERKKSWEMNFSAPVVFAFEEYTKMLRSSELKVGKLVKKIINPFRAR
jgi:glycosyltransferase involved in cell wall biosynthesis